MASDTPIAMEMAKRQKEISVAEFFTKNRHLLGFDNKRKSLLMTVKEAVDNSIDACEEARILPEISIELINVGDYRYRVIIEDNGPGIVKKQIPSIFAQLLYGSKFHSLKQSRGQQGIGISAAVLYAQLTTGRPAKITSRIGPNHPAHYYELQIDAQKNKPQIVKDEQVEWKKEHGTRIELDIEADYMKGRQSVDEYLKQTAVVNPHVTIIYTNPKAEQVIFPRVTEALPAESKAIKPHPYGVELGMLMNLLRFTEARTLQSFLSSEFSRVGSGTAKEICENSGLQPSMKPADVTRDHAEQLIKGIQKTKLIAPPTDCLSPITEPELEKGLRKEINAEFYVTKTRAPAVYRGNPFIIEVGIAYGGEIPKDQSIGLLRFANRVPLLYQEGACGMTKAIQETNWKSYGIQQSGRSMPQGPAVVVVHMASAWVPFTSESKEAIAHYQDILKEIKLAIQECGRQLGSYVRKKHRVSQQMERISMFERYIPEIADSIATLAEGDKKKIEEALKGMLDKPELKQEVQQETDDEDAKLYRMSFDKDEGSEEEGKQDE